MFERDGVPMPPGASLAEVLDGVVLTALSDHDLVDALSAWDRQECLAAAGKAAVIGEMSRRAALARAAGDVCAEDFTGDEVAAALHISRWAGDNAVELAAYLRRRPRIGQLLAGGELTVAKVRILNDATACLDPDTASAVEDQVLPAAPMQTPPQLRSAVQRAVQALSKPEEVEAAHQQAYADRRVSLSPQPNGMAEIWALLRADHAQALYAALTGLATDSQTADRQTATGDVESVATVGADTGTGTGAGPDPFAAPGSLGCVRTLDQARADALTDLVQLVQLDQVVQPDSSELPEEVTSPGDSGTDTSATISKAPGGGAATHRPSSGAAAKAKPAAKPAIHVTVPACVLTGCTTHLAHLHGHGPIPPSLATELAADNTRWRRLLTDPADGALLDLGHTTYAPSAALDRHVRARDLTCRFIGCRQPAERTDLDHTIAWAATDNNGKQPANQPSNQPEKQQGGPTADYNLGALCRHHHRLKTHSNWGLTQTKPGHFTWTSPTGHTYDVTPPELYNTTAGTPCHQPKPTREPEHPPSSESPPRSTPPPSSEPPPGSEPPPRSEPPPDDPPPF